MIFLIICQIYTEFSATHFIFFHWKLCILKNEFAQHIIVTILKLFSILIKLLFLNKFDVALFFNLLLFFPALWWKLSWSARENQAESDGLITSNLY